MVSDAVWMDGLVLAFGILINLLPITTAGVGVLRNTIFKFPPQRNY